MKIKSMAGFFGLWCAVLATGTWILPVRALAMPVAILLDETDEANEVALALASEIEAMRLAGEFDRPAFIFDAVDLNGDGVGEFVEVSPPQQLETPGWMRVFDGATEAALYMLQPSVAEMGFGEHAAVVNDCDGDGLPDLAVWSWLEVPQAPSPISMEVRIRVFAGASGELIGVLRAEREFGQAVVLSDFVVEVAGDANLDGAIDVIDIVEVSAAVGTEAALMPTVDCKADGELTIADLGAVVQRVVEEPVSRRVQLYSVGLRNLSLVEPIAPPGEGINPSSTGGRTGEPPCDWGWQGGPQCWAQVGYLAYDLVKFLRNQSLCVGPQAFACAFLNMCADISILNQLLLLVDQCYTNGACLPPWFPYVTLILGILAKACSEGLSSLNAEKRGELLDLIERLRREM